MLHTGCECITGKEPFDVEIKPMDILTSAGEINAD